MASMLTTVWLVLGALSFAVVMEHAGILERIIQPIVARPQRRVADRSGRRDLHRPQRGRRRPVRRRRPPGRMFRNEFARRGLAPQVLSRAVEDSGTVTSVLVPWNTCGAYMAGVLGVSTTAYFPYCFFNLLSPLLDVLYGYLGFKVLMPRGPGRTTTTDTANPPAVPEGDLHV